MEEEEDLRGLSYGEVSGGGRGECVGHGRDDPGQVVLHGYVRQARGQVVTAIRPGGETGSSGPPAGWSFKAGVLKWGVPLGVLWSTGGGTQTIEGNYNGS